MRTSIHAGVFGRRGTLWLAAGPSRFGGRSGRPQAGSDPLFGVPNLVYPQGVATCLGTRGVVRAFALRAWFLLRDASLSCPHLAFHDGHDAPCRMLRKCSGTSRLRPLALTALYGASSMCVVGGLVR